MLIRMLQSPSKRGEATISHSACHTKYKNNIRQIDWNESMKVAQGLVRQLSLASIALAVCCSSAAIPSLPNQIPPGANALTTNELPQQDSIWRPLTQQSAWYINFIWINVVIMLAGFLAWCIVSFVCVHARSRATLAAIFRESRVRRVWLGHASLETAQATSTRPNHVASIGIRQEPADSRRAGTAVGAQRDDHDLLMQGAEGERAVTGLAEQRRHAEEFRARERAFDQLVTRMQMI